MLIQVFADFCAATPKRYAYLREQSREYQKQIRADAVMLHRRDQSPFPVIALASGDGATMHIANIVPQVGSTLDVATYNSFVTELVGDLRRFRKTTKTPIIIRCTGAEFTLKNIIPAVKTRRLFEQFLALHPTSHHPSDVRRLDVFICAVHRYCRGHLNCNRLRRYLVEVLNWTPPEAEWCRNRILTGLDILEVHRDY